MTIRTNALLVLAAVALFGLAACDGGDQSERTAPEEAASGPGEATSSSAQETGTPGPDTMSDGEETGTSEATDQTAEPESQTAESEASEPARVAASGDGEAAANALGCTACHAAETQLVGPSYQAVAEKYGGDKAKILERMKKAVKNGASGTWSDVTGGTPMPPQPQAAGKTDQLDTIAEWIAGMAG